jgi:hypothetical protein
MLVAPVNDGRVLEIVIVCGESNIGLRNSMVSDDGVAFAIEMAPRKLQSSGAAVHEVRAALSEMLSTTRGGGESAEHDSEETLSPLAAELLANTTLAVCVPVPFAGTEQLTETFIEPFGATVVPAGGGVSENQPLAFPVSVAELIVRFAVPVFETVMLLTEVVPVSTLPKFLSVTLMIGSDWTSSFTMVPTPARSDPAALNPEPPLRLRANVSSGSTAESPLTSTVIVAEVDPGLMISVPLVA